MCTRDQAERSKDAIAGQSNRENLHALQKNVANSREALIQKEKTGEKRKRCEQMVSIITFALLMIGGPALMALNGALNLVEPLHLLCATVNKTLASRLWTRPPK